MPYFPSFPITHGKLLHAIFLSTNPGRLYHVRRVGRRNEQSASNQRRGEKGGAEEEGEVGNLGKGKGEGQGRGKGEGRGRGGLG